MLQASFTFEVANLAHAKQLRKILARIGGKPGPVYSETGEVITAAQAAEMLERKPEPPAEQARAVPDGF